MHVGHTSTCICSSSTADSMLAEQRHLNGSLGPSCGCHNALQCSRVDCWHPGEKQHVASGIGHNVCVGYIDQVALFDQRARLVQCECACACRLKGMIREGLERNHSKVQVASLELFSEAFLACPAVFEDALTDLLPPLLVLVNARNQQAQTKAAALRNELGRRLPACSLCPAIVHSIRSVRPVLILTWHLLLPCSLLVPGYLCC